MMLSVKIDENLAYLSAWREEVRKSETARTPVLQQGSIDDASNA